MTTFTENSQTAALPSTVFLLHGDADDDVSQYDATLSAGTSPVRYTAAATPQCDLDGSGDGRTLVLRVEGLSTSATNTEMFHHRDTVAANPVQWRIRYQASGNLIILDGFTAAGGYEIMLQVAAPGIDATARDFLVYAVTTPNPDTTGAADAAYSWMLVHNVDTGDRAWVQGSHRVNRSGSGYVMNVGGRYASSTSSLLAPNAIAFARVDNKAIPIPILDDLYATARSDGTPSGSTEETRDDPYAPPTEVAAADQYMGQAHLGYYGHHVREAEARGFSPLWTALYSTTVDLASSNDEWYVTAPGSSEHRLLANAAKWCAVPTSAARAKCWAFVRVWDTSGGAEDKTVTLRFYSLSSKPPSPYDLGSTEPDYDYSEVTVTADHASGAGVWVEFDPVNIRRRGGPTRLRDTTYLVVAFEPGADADNTGCTLHAITVWPLLSSLRGAGPQGALVMP